MAKYYNKKYNFAVEGFKVEPGKFDENFATVPEFSKMFSEIPETYWLIKHENTKMLISDELFHRFFVREPAFA